MFGKRNQQIFVDESSPSSSPQSVNHHFANRIETGVVGAKAHVEAVERLVVDAALVLLDEEVLVLDAVRRSAIYAVRVQADRARGDRRAYLHHAAVSVAFGRPAHNIITRVGGFDVPEKISNKALSIRYLILLFMAEN